MPKIRIRRVIKQSENLNPALSSIDNFGVPDKYDYLLNNIRLMNMSVGLKSTPIN
jgi:hypothetical protein